jgi:protein-L-isoaspartate(D-aspartate) O-methyltransferase
MFVPTRRHLTLTVARLVLAALAAASIPPALSAKDDAFSAARGQMLADIQATAAGVGRAGGREGISDATLGVLAVVPRHLFVPEDRQSLAYENRPMPIGYGQTISQPYIVAVMTDFLACEPTHTVLEVGTGSGYQAAVLSLLTRKVFSIEIIPQLAQSAEARLRQLGYANIEVRTGDGYYGWPETAPFDRIIVTAAASHIPPPLIAQLKIGGRMLIPVGGPFAVQELMMVEKRDDGSLLTRHLLPVQFVPMTGGR